VDVNDKNSSTCSQRESDRTSEQLQNRMLRRLRLATGKASAVHTRGGGTIHEETKKINSQNEKRDLSTKKNTSENGDQAKNRNRNKNMQVNKT
jgi:hypothetical protein